MINYFLNILILITAQVISAQQALPEMKERVVLVTDRNLYAAGEKIHFSALVQSDNKADTTGSTILYCELVTPEGGRVTGSKFQVDNSIAEGSLTIPDDIHSGNYFIRGYTRFMRNYGPASFPYTLVKIVNAGRKEVQLNYEAQTIRENLLNNEFKDDTDLVISTGRSWFHSRDTLHVSFGISWEEKNYKNVVLSVVPWDSFIENGEVTPREPRTSKEEYFYPERTGVSLTGRVINKVTGRVLTNVRVSLSILGKGHDFMAMRTDPAGRFYFLLPGYSGYRDVFICTEKSDSLNSAILIDNDYCSVPVSIPAPAFELSPEERESALNLAVNLQVSRHFTYEAPARVSDEDQKNDMPFYGKPDEVLLFDKYIGLPTLEEYFNGLPTLVKVRKRHGEKYFKVLGRQTELSEFDPMVMVDMVAIDDPQKILVLDPQKIHSIEVVNSIYIKGNQIYGGIINIITKGLDFAGIDLPSSGIFINYGFLDENRNYISAAPLISDRNIPDARNTLFWDPEFKLPGKNSVLITAPDTPGRYVIVLTGINAGTTFRKTAAFDVIK
jgi:hypothetical protein